MEENEGIKKASQRLEEISQDEIMQRINGQKPVVKHNKLCISVLFIACR